VSFAETVAVIRDFAFLVLIVVATLATLIVFFKVSALLNSTKRALRDAEDVVSTVSGRILGPAMASSRVAFGAGKILAFVLGLRRKQQKRGGDDDGKQR